MPPNSSSPRRSPSLMEEDHTVTHNDLDSYDDNVVKREESHHHERKGTIWSARLNLLSSMVGGVSLSMPFIFSQLGNVLLAPLILMAVALSIKSSFIYLIRSSTGGRGRGGGHKTTLEAVASAAFGSCAKTFTSIVLVAILFFAVAGYAILIRDVTKPLADLVQPQSDGAPSSSKGVTVVSNLIMAGLLLLITPLTTLRTYTALKNVSFFSMISIGILTICIVCRSIECNLSPSTPPLRDYIRLLPPDANAVLSSLPVLISAYICHFNLLPVYSELQNPSEETAQYLSKSTTAVASLFYLCLGIFGSFHGNCTGGTVSGNILLDFDDNDVLMSIGRICLGITVSFAFPMLVIPARDIIIRWIAGTRIGRHCCGRNKRAMVGMNDDIMLDEPLLDPTQDEETTATITTETFLIKSESDGESERDREREATAAIDNFRMRVVVAVVFFWSAILVACMVESVDIVWELLGSCLSIIIGFIVPIGSYLVLCQNDGNSNLGMRIQGWILLVIYSVAMVVFTIHSFYGVFFK